MKVRVVKVFGHEVLRIESHEEATVSDVVRAMVAQRLRNAEMNEDDEYGDLVEGLIPCECCGEMFDPDEADLNDEVNARFADMTERLLWSKPASESDDDDEQ
jgi:hypothetical protein